MFNREKFFNEIRPFFKLKGYSLTQKRVDALEYLLGQFEADPAWKDVRHIAYALATIAHETAWTFEPIKEKRERADSPRRKNQDRYWLSGFYGRGYVQITWDYNYEKFGIKDDPDKALDRDTAFFILTKGMHSGLFTGHKLSDYIQGLDCDYVNARKIINGRDKAQLIAGYAKEFERILRDAKEEDVFTETRTTIEVYDKDIATDVISNQIEDYEKPKDYIDIVPVSGSSKAVVGATLLVGIGAAIKSFVTDNWVFIIAAAVILLIAGLSWYGSKQRAHQKTLLLNK